MKVSRKEQERRRAKWRAGLLVSATGRGQCACCNRTACLRHISHGPGDICEECYVTKPRCTVKGCNEPAVKYAKGRCRDHFLNVDGDVPRVEDFGGHRMSAIADCPNASMPDDWKGI